MIPRLAALSLALLLAACGPFDTMKEGFAHSQAVADDLQKSLGVKPFVGFNWNNGTLTNVSVTFDGVPPNMPLADITARTKEAVVAEFKQTPQQIVVGFSIRP